MCKCFIKEKKIQNWKNTVHGSTNLQAHVQFSYPLESPGHKDCKQRMFYLLLTLHHSGTTKSVVFDWINT